MKMKTFIVAAVLAASPLVASAAGLGSAAQPPMDDAALSRAVQARIDAVPYLRAGDVRVQTVHHVVFIHGTVDTVLQSANAEAAVQAAAGGAAVVNLVDVANGPA